MLYEYFFIGDENEDSPAVLRQYAFRYNAQHTSSNEEKPITKWLLGLGVWFSLWVREVIGSNPVGAQVLFFFFCVYRSKYVGGLQGVYLLQMH